MITTTTHNKMQLKKRLISYFLLLLLGDVLIFIMFAASGATEIYLREFSDLGSSLASLHIWAGCRLLAIFRDGMLNKGQTRKGAQASEEVTELSTIPPPAQSIPGPAALHQRQAQGVQLEPRDRVVNKALYDDGRV